MLFRSVSALAAEFAPPERAGKLKSKGGSKRHVIFEPSDIVAFQLVRDGGAPPPYDAAVGAGAGRRTERATFRYPASVYLDQFMRESYALASAKRAEQRGLLEEVRELEERKRNLLRFNVRLVSLRFSELALGDADAVLMTTGQGRACRLAVVPVLLRERRGKQR